MTHTRDLRALAAGDVVGNWCVVHKIGGGTFGAVYRAHRWDAPRELGALKVLAPNDTVSHSYSTGSFKREAEALKHIDHPNVVRLLDWGENPDHLVMEYVEGKSLAEYLKTCRYGEARLTLSKLAFILWQVSYALIHLRALHMVHRDIKEANIILHPWGIAKVVDFGLACSDEMLHITQENLAPGAFPYMPPECWDARLPRSDPHYERDVYALGVVAIGAARLIHPSLPDAGDSLPPDCDMDTALWALFSEMVADHPFARPQIADVGRRLMEYLVQCGRQGEDMPEWTLTSLSPLTDDPGPTTPSPSPAPATLSPADPQVPHQATPSASAPRGPRTLLGLPLPYTLAIAALLLWLLGAVLLLVHILAGPPPSL